MATGQQPVGSSDHEVSHFHVHHLDFPETVLGTQIAAPAFCSTIFSRPPNRLLLSTAWWFESLQTEILVFGHHHHHHLNFTGPETYHLSNSSNHKPVGVSLSKVVSLVGFFFPTGPPLKREDVSGTSNSLTSRGLRPLQPSLHYRWSPFLKTKILHSLQRSFRFFARRNMIIIGLSQFFRDLWLYELLWISVNSHFIAIISKTTSLF